MMFIWNLRKLPQQPWNYLSLQLPSTVVFVCPDSFELSSISTDKLLGELAVEQQSDLLIKKVDFTKACEGTHLAVTLLWSFFSTPKITLQQISIFELSEHNDWTDYTYYTRTVKYLVKGHFVCPLISGLRKDFSPIPGMSLCSQCF